MRIRRVNPPDGRAQLSLAECVYATHPECQKILVQAKRAERQGTARCLLSVALCVHGPRYAECYLLARALAR